MTKLEDPQNLIKKFLNDSQRERVDNFVQELQKGGTHLAKLIEDLRPGLTEREADIRANGINELCAILLSLGAKNAGVTYQFDSRDCDFLLEFLSSRVEDSGHLADLLITAVHYLITAHYDIKSPLQNSQLDRTLALFENSGVQSYGQRDRQLLYAIFEHLLETHCEQMRLLGSQRTVMAFLRMAQGEREPRLLLAVFRIHQKLCTQFRLGVLVEDMFELVACYFPIDYEPDEEKDAKEAGPLITREMLRHGLECCLLASPDFGPFCFQLLVEKLVESDAEMAAIDAVGSSEASALIDGQLEVCELLTAACQRFDGPPEDGLEQTLDDLMTGFRLIFMNPAQNPGLLQRSSQVVGRTMRALAETMLGRGSGAELLLKQMADTTLENIEPFVLQAEMGTMGKAFRLLSCLAQSDTTALAIVIPRVLYWLNVLVGGQTLTSPQNRAEIALEALEWLPHWLRICVGFEKLAPAYGLEAVEEMVSSAVLPLIAQMFAIDEVCSSEKRKLVEHRCRALSVLLLPLCTRQQAADDPPCMQMFADSLLQNGQLFSAHCVECFQTILSVDFNGEEPDKRPNPVKQLLALLAAATHKFGDVFVQETGANVQIQKLPLSLQPAMIFPLPSELEGRKLLLDITDPSQEECLGRVIASTFEQIADAQNATAASAALVELAERVASNNGTFITRFMQMVEQAVEAFLQRQTEQQQKEVEEADLLVGKTIHAVGATLLRHQLRPHHMELCQWALTLCSKFDQKMCQYRILQLLMLQCQQLEPLIGFLELALSLLHGANATNTNEQSSAIEGLLYHGCFALFNRSTATSQTNDTEPLLSKLRQELSEYTASQKRPPSTVDFRLQLLGTRSAMLSRRVDGPNRLKECFSSYLLSADERDQQEEEHLGKLLVELLNFSEPATDPESCFYNRTELWRQRIFCQFVPIYLHYLKEISTEANSSASRNAIRKQHMLGLVQPLLQLVSQIPMDSLLGELTKLAPVIAKALPFALHADSLWPCDSLLDGLLLLLRKLPPSGENQLSNEFLHSIVTCTSDAVLGQQRKHSLNVLLKIFECLEIIAQYCAPNRKELLSPIYGRVIRACVEMSGSKKRLIRRQVANARNAWELMLT